MATTDSDTPRSLTDLLAELEAAVRAGDRERATELARKIIQRINTETRQRESVERQVRDLMQRMAEAELIPKSRLSLDGELGPAPPEGRVYPVWFGTNRKPARNGGYTGERQDPIAVARGRVDVFVPKAHRIGETGTSLWERLKRLEPRDDNLRIQRVKIHQERDAFFACIHDAIQAVRDRGEQPHALFFLHGFNVTFEEAAIRTAQLGCDLNLAGVAAFFSWPSRGGMVAYPIDEATIEASEGAITDFLVDFTENCHAEKVHIIAHSMGNRGLLRALQRIAAKAETRGKVKFDQIVLAAPDVDQALFLDLAHLYAEHATRTTLYASQRDIAVHFSAKLHDAPRAGYFTPYTVANSIDTVVVPDFDVDLLGHSYFAKANALLNDIFELMQENKAPSARFRIAKPRPKGELFWSLKR
jgi:esterase/lipase superfamily enzyme